MKEVRSVPVAGPPPPAPPMRLTAQTRPIVLFAVTYVVVVLLFATVTAWTDYAGLRSTKIAEASRLAVLMAERFERSATATDIILRAMQARAEDLLATGKPLSDLPWPPFRNAAEALPDPGSLWLVDAHGDLQRASTTAETPNYNFADREYFAPHNRGVESYLSGAVKGRITGQYHWLISRRIDGPGGAFAGVVLAAMEDTGLAAIHKAVDLGPGSVLSVRRADGALMMRHPMRDGLIGSDPHAGRQTAALLASGAMSGWFVGPLDDDGADYLHAWRRIDRHGMIAFVRLPVSTLWQQWKPQATVYAALVLASLVPLAFLVRLGMRSADTEARARASLERIAAHQRQLLRDQETVVVRQRLFLDTVGHEFRTPLAIIDSTAQVLGRMTPQQDEATRARLEKIRRATRRLTDLLDTCLAEERLGDDGDSLRLAAIDLRLILADLSREWPRLKVRPGPPAVVQADGPLLAIAIHNIVENALKYSPREAPVEVAINQLLRETTITVTDHGEGIDPQDLPHIFEKFYRSHAPQENKPGMGLGLNIAKKIVEQHGGRIELRSERNAGTTFSIVLPAPQPAAAVPSPASLNSLTS